MSVHRYFLLVIGRWKVEGWGLWRLVPNPGKGNPSCVRWARVGLKELVRPSTQCPPRRVS